MKNIIRTGLKFLSLTAFTVASVLSISMISNSNKSLNAKALPEVEYIDFEITGLDRTTAFIDTDYWRFEFKTSVSFNNVDGTVENNLKADLTNTTMIFDSVKSSLLNSEKVTCQKLSTTEDDFTILLAKNRLTDPATYDTNYPNLPQGTAHLIEMPQGTTFGKYRLAKEISINIDKHDQAWLNVELEEYKNVQNSDLYVNGALIGETFSPRSDGQMDAINFDTDLSTNSFVYRLNYTHANSDRAIDMRHDDWGGLRLMFTAPGAIEYWPNGSNSQTNGKQWELGIFAADTKYLVEIGCIDIKNSNYVWMFVNVDEVKKISFLQEKKANTKIAGFSTWGGSGTVFAQVDYTVIIDGVRQTVLPGQKVTRPEHTETKDPDVKQHYHWEWVNNGTVWNFDDEVHSDLNLVGQYIGEDHSWVAGERIEPTCDQAGSQKSECSVCHYINTETIDPLGHTLTKTEAVAATCEAAGNTEYYTCSVCNKYFSDVEGTNEITANSWVVASTGHELTKTEAVAATCEAAGNTEYYTCSKCNKYFSDAEGKSEITANSWVVVSSHELTKTEAVAATCEAAGNTEYYTCSKCNKYFSDAEGKSEIAKDSWKVASTGHTLTKTEAVAATCEAAGNTEYYTCSKCNKYFSDAEGKSEIAKDSWKVASTGHTYKDGSCETCETKDPDAKPTKKGCKGDVVAFSPIAILAALFVLRKKSKKA